MAEFKDIVAADLDVFINTDEFGDYVQVNNLRIPVTIDLNKLQERSKIEFDGLVVGDVLYFAKADAFPKMPKSGDIQSLNGVPHIVEDARGDMGMYEIILKSNVS